MKDFNIIGTTCNVCEKCLTVYNSAFETDGCPECLAKAEQARDEQIKLERYRDFVHGVHTMLDGQEWDVTLLRPIADGLETLGLPVSVSVHAAPSSGIDTDYDPCSDCEDALGCSLCDAPEGNETPDTGCPDIDMGADYYEQNRGTDKPSGAAVSRDDQNRRLRESRLGFAAPSDDWAEAGTPIVCIYDGQKISTRGIFALLDLGLTSGHQYITGYKFTL